MTFPLCQHCTKPARLVAGVEVYPHRSDLAEKRFWLCECGARCGCHPGTTKALGRPANAELRGKRQDTHRILDPLWREAYLDPHYNNNHDRRKVSRERIVGLARNRVYAWLAEQMGLTEDECHVGMFDVAQCNAAIKLLLGRHYAEIRSWAKQQSVTIREERSAA